MLRQARNGLAAASALSMGIKLLAWAVTPMIPLLVVLLIAVALADRVFARRK